MKPLTPRALRGPLHPVRPVRPVRVLVVLALGAVLGTSACGQAATPGGTPTPAGGGSTGTPGGPGSAPGAVEPVTVGGVRLEAQMAPGDPVPSTAMGANIAATPGLVVEYTLTNTGAAPVLAYDVVPQDLGSAALTKDVDPGHAWVYDESGVLRLSKQGFAPAPNVRFAAAPAIGGHIIAPGASIKGRADAEWPPSLDVPGTSFEAPRAAPDPGVKQWQLCIQVSDQVGGATPAAIGDDIVQAASAAPQGDDLVCTKAATIPVA